MDTWSFPGVKSNRGVTLTPHPLLVPWSWKSRAIPLLPLWAVRPVQSLSACTRDALYTKLINVSNYFPTTRVHIPEDLNHEQFITAHRKLNWLVTNVYVMCPRVKQRVKTVYSGKSAFVGRNQAMNRSDQWHHHRRNGGKLRWKCFVKQQWVWSCIEIKIDVFNNRRHCWSVLMWK